MTAKERTAKARQGSAAIAYTVEAHVRGYRMLVIYSGTRAPRYEGGCKSMLEIDRYVARFYPGLPRVADRYSIPSLLGSPSL
jgi:hypothetical protein